MASIKENVCLPFRFHLVRTDLNCYCSAGRSGWSALTTAADLGKESIIRLFYDYGIDLDVLDGNKWSALHAAARRGQHQF